MDKLKIVLVSLSIISVIVFIGSIIYFISPPTLKQIVDVESMVLFGERSYDLTFTTTNNVTYKDLITLNNATKVFDKSIARYNNMLVISDTYSSVNILPDSIPYNELIIEVQIENINNGLNVSLKGNTTIPKGYQGHFFFNSTKNNWISFDDNSKFNFTWQYSLTSENVITIKTTENATDIIETNVIEKAYTNYKSLDVIFNTNKGLIFSKEAYLDPDVTQCGSINSAGVYTLTNSSIINYPQSCIIINSSHVDFSCNNYTLDGTTTYQRYAITNVGSKASATNFFTNVSVHDCYLQEWDNALAFQYLNNSNFNNIVTKNLRSATGYGFSLSTGNNLNVNINNISTTGSGQGGVNIGAGSGGGLNLSNSYASDVLYGFVAGYTTTTNPYIITNSTAINVSYGIRFTHAGADRALVYNNFFNVTTAYTLITAGADGYFNITNTTGTNIVGGSQIGGNFWANKTGGYSETCTDANADGFCDVRFNVTSGLACPACTGFNIDYFPLTKFTAPSGDNYPTFTNIVTSPINNSYYSPNVYYQFNSTIANTNGTAGIGFNGANYSASNISTIFNTSVFNLGVGTYSYYWWAYGDGASHFFNTTGLYDYVVNKTVPPLIVTINPGTSVPYQTETIAVGEGCPSQLVCNLSRNNVTVNTTDVQTLGVGTYQYIFNTSGNANYTNASNSDILTVTQIASVTTLTFNATSPQLYPNQIIPTCTLTTGQGAPILKVDGNTITSGSAIRLGVGTHAFNCSMGNTQNYTGSSDSYDFVINQGTPPLILSVIPGLNVIQGTQTTATGSGCPAELVCNLSRNNVTVDNPDVQILVSGDYQYIFNTSGNVNYTLFSTNVILSVNATFDLDYPLFSNYWDDNNTIQFNGTASFNVTVLKTNGTVYLHINGTRVEATNSTADVYNATVYLTQGTYNYNWSSYGNGTAHWLNYSSEQSYTILPDTTAPQVNLTNPPNNFYSLNTTQNFTANFSDAHRLKNATLFIYNGTGLYNITSFNLGSNFQVINGGTMVKNLADNQYNWSYQAFDNQGNSFTTPNWTLTIDTINPVISYDTGTASNYANVSRNWIYVNTIWTEINFANITFYLFNDTANVNTTVFTTATYNFNFTNLINGNYSYQVNITDLVSHVTSTGVRYIKLDFTPPNGTLISPTNGSLNRTTTQNFTVNASDNDGLFNATLYIYNQTGIYNISTTNITGKTGIIGWVTGLIDGIYTWFVDIFDSTGNYFRTGNFTVTIDTTPPYFTSFPNKTQYDDEALSYTIGASDAMTAVNCFNVNATYNFSITCGGVLTSSVGMVLGYHYINITVNDTLNNKISGVMWFNVLNYSDVPTEPFTWYNDSETPNNRLFAIAENGDVILEKNGSVSRRRVGTKFWFAENGDLNFQLQS